MTEPEAEKFFSSIALRPTANKPVYFEPSQGGFGIMLPQAPSQYRYDLN
ncbi:hypothetical protein BH11BAC4_BH11BAC4_20490 [soil metagenome]